MKRKQNPCSRKASKICIDEELQTFLDQVHLESEADKEQPEINQEDFDRVRLNISGTIFETYRSTLTRKEGSIFKEDDTWRHYYDDINEEYYFDRNPKAFEAIFEFMQCGILKQPTKVPGRETQVFDSSCSHGDKLFLSW